MELRSVRVAPTQATPVRRRGHYARTDILAARTAAGGAATLTE